MELGIVAYAFVLFVRLGDVGGLQQIGSFNKNVDCQVARRIIYESMKNESRVVMSECFSIVRK